jgi:hypothetical protein
MRLASSSHRNQRDRCCINLCRIFYVLILNL